MTYSVFICVCLAITDHDTGFAKHIPTFQKRKDLLLTPGFIINAESRMTIDLWLLLFTEKSIAHHISKMVN